MLVIKCDAFSSVGVGVREGSWCSSGGKSTAQTAAYSWLWKVHGPQRTDVSPRWISCCTMILLQLRDQSRDVVYRRRVKFVPIYSVKHRLMAYCICLGEQEKAFIGTKVMLIVIMYNIYKVQ